MINNNISTLTSSSLRWQCGVVITRWSRSMQLLYTGQGYYLDGCWQVNRLGMYLTT